jgi:phosphoribosylanthranilate isomerase
MGADAVGLNMFIESPRYVDPEAAARLVADTSPLVTTVGVFVNHGSDEITRLLKETRFDLLQFHGEESDDFCASFKRPFIKVIRVDEETDIANDVDEYPSASGFLLDSKVKGVWGGSGKSFDWSKVPALGKPVLLAGGLNPTNVGDAIRQVRPFAVDVAGGVEIEPGRKDERKVKEFMIAVDAADEELND